MYKLDMLSLKNPIDRKYVISVVRFNWESNQDIFSVFESVQDREDLTHDLDC